MFNSTYTAAPYANCYLEAWAWTDSPYMTASGRDKDLYYLDIPLNYEKVIFFCDVEHADGINYKTSDLILPSDSQYRLPCYYQSPIGYNGIWGDVETKKITVYIQSKSEEGYATIEDEIPTATVDNKSYVLNRIGHIGIGVGSTGLYYSIDIPAECSTITLTKGDIAADFELQEICYNMPIFYVDKWTDTDNPAWKVFDGTIDNSFIWHTRYSQSEWKLYQELYKYLYDNTKSIDRIDTELAKLSVLRNLTTAQLTALAQWKDCTLSSGTKITSMVADGETYSSSYHYYRIGNIVCIWGDLRFDEMLIEDKSYYFINLPYSICLSEYGDDTLSSILKGTTVRSKVSEGLIKYTTSDNEEKTMPFDMFIKGTSTIYMVPEKQSTLGDTEFLNNSYVQFSFDNLFYLTDDD